MKRVKLTVGVQGEVCCEWPLPRLLDEDRGREAPLSLASIRWPVGPADDDGIELSPAVAGPNAEVPDERAKGFAEDITEERND